MPPSRREVGGSPSSQVKGSPTRFKGREGLREKRVERARAGEAVPDEALGEAAEGAPGRWPLPGVDSTAHYAPAGHGAAHCHPAGLLREAPASGAVDRLRLGTHDATRDVAGAAGWCRRSPAPRHSRCDSRCCRRSWDGWGFLRQRRRLCRRRGIQPKRARSSGGAGRRGSAGQGRAPRHQGPRRGRPLSIWCQSSREVGAPWRRRAGPWAFAVREAGHRARETHCHGRRDDVAVDDLDLGEQSWRRAARRTREPSK